MTDPRDQIEELLAQADALDEGPAQVALVEEAVRLADAHNDTEAGFHARKQVVQAATFGGQPDVALVAFSWCLAQCDHEPEEYDESELLWQYKWVIENLPDFPHVSRKQIEGLFADMTRRYERNGSTLHAVHQTRRDVAVQMNDRTAAEEANARFEQTPRDHLSNCRACVNDANVEYRIFLGDDAGALDAARPALEGKVTCGEVPHRTYSYVLLPLLRMGKVERAVRYYKAGYKLVRANPKFVRQKSYHLAFLALTGNLDRAVRLFERHLAEATRTPSAYWRFEFYAAVRLFLDRLTTGKAVPLVRVPEELREGPEPTRPATAVAAWLDGQLHELAIALDARNGNDGFARRLGWFRDQAWFAVPHRIDGKE
jgi:hypothetical protein